MFKLTRKLSMVGLGALLASVAASTALAGPTPQTTTFTVTATVAKSCKVSATNLAFGAYDVLNASDTTSTNTISVTCTNGTPFTVALNVGTGAGATFASRVMTDSPATDKLLYSLYTAATTSPGCTGANIWGDGTGVTKTVAGTGAGPGAPQSLTVNGCVPAAQNAVVSGNTYTDTITVTVTF